MTNANIFVSNISFSNIFFDKTSNFLTIFKIDHSNLSLTQTEFNNKNLIALIDSQKSNVYLNNCSFLNNNYDDNRPPFIYFIGSNNSTFEITLINITFENNIFNSLAFFVSNESEIKIILKNFNILGNDGICILFDSLTESVITFDGFTIIGNNYLCKINKLIQMILFSFNFLIIYQRSQ